MKILLNITKQWLCLAAIFLLWSATSALAQSGAFHIPEFSGLSPQTYEFAQAGLTPVSHFTGEVNVKVPLYTYKDRDFEIPIYLGYNSSGFMPNKRESIVGLNWHLNAGGVITRSVNGWPDEKEGRPKEDLNVTKLHGYYYGIKKGLIHSSITNEDIYNISYGNLLNTENEYWQLNGCELEPDEFTFHVPGHSGKFFIGTDGKAHFSDNAPYKLDLTYFTLQPSKMGRTIFDSELVLTTDDGYKYYFGGTYQHLEVYFPVCGLGTSTVDAEATAVIVAWHLTKIVAPNGRTVTYQYRIFKDTNSPDELDKHLDKEHYLLHINFADYWQYESSCHAKQDGEKCWYEAVAPIAGPSYSVTKTAYLEKIIVEGGAEIEFKYWQQTGPFYFRNYINHKYNHRNLQLDEVHVRAKAGETPIKSYKMDYRYKGWEYGRRLFLTSVNGSGEPPYTFSYYNHNTIPDPLTLGIDHWGYWNGRDDNAFLTPKMVETYGEVEIIGDQRDPNPLQHDACLLEKISYPTGGSTTYFYEPHTYSLRLERRNASNFLPILYPKEGVTGGARIKKIVDNDGMKDYNVREFEYVNNYPTSLKSSGILLDWPLYMVSWKYEYNRDIKYMVKRQSSSFHQNHHPGQKFLHYAVVTEVNKTDNSYTTYKFTNYYTNPDVREYGKKVVDEHYNTYVTNIHAYNNYVGIQYSDLSFERGKPYEIIHYNNAGQPVSRQEFEYTNRKDYPNNYVAGSFRTGAIAVSYKQFTYPHLPVKQKHHLYTPEGRLIQSTTTTLSYTAENYLASKTVSASDGSTRTEYTSYVADYSNTTGFIGDMKNQHMLNRPIEQVVYKTNSNNSIEILSGSLTTYKTGGKGWPDQVFVLETADPIPLASFKFANYVNGKLPNSQAKQAFVYDSRYYSPQRSFVSYDVIGNPTEIKERDGTVVKYEWSTNYNRLYPTAKIISTPQGARRSTYTFKPLVGMETETDENGITITYVYDANNRLQFIKDKDGAILKKFDYKYKLAD